MSEFWVQTVSGQDVDLVDTDPASIDINDIATALSQQARYNGHARSFYSVAEHSVRVAVRVRELVPPGNLFAARLELHGLLHDAHEAYVGDVVTPFKRVLNGLAGRDIFAQAEDAVRIAVARKFELELMYPTRKDPLVVQRADAELYVTEKRDIMPNVPGEREWRRPYAPLNETIYPWGAATARVLFLDHFDRIKALLETFK
jgi:hypothetical protein